jgi:RNA recognition motif-containing protein
MDHRREVLNLGKLFVGQIPKEINEAVLSSYFDKFGAIKEVMIVRDLHKISKGK